MGTNYSFEVKNIEIWVPAFFKHNNSSVVIVTRGMFSQEVKKEMGISHTVDMDIMFIGIMSTRAG